MHGPKIISLIILLIIFAFISSVSAQDSPVKSIPAIGQMFGFRLSPDGQTIALFENTVIHLDEIIDEDLPIGLVNISDGTMGVWITEEAIFVIQTNSDDNLIYIITL